MLRYVGLLVVWVVRIRLCRPGSVIGPQQQYLRMQEPLMWQAGKEMRDKARGAFEDATSGSAQAGSLDEEETADEEESMLSPEKPVMFSAEERKIVGSAPPTPDRPKPSRPAVSPSHFPGHEQKTKNAKLRVPATGNASKVLKF